jgi:Zn-dependent peptidase ImmA (M78 family)
MEREALQVLDAYNITEPVVDVRKIAAGEGYRVLEIQMPPEHHDVAGFHDNDKKIIYVAAGDPPQRKLFTIAHELGHIFLAHPNYSVLYRLTKKDAEYAFEEREANSFAAHLLMPNYLVKQYLNKYNLSRSDYKTMAEIFGVPLASMQYTLDWLEKGYA